MNSELICISKWCRSTFNKDEVILCNTSNGIWIKIPREIFEIIENIAEEEIFYGELRTFFAEKEDYQYVKQIIDKLLEIGILCFMGNDYKSELREIQFSLTNRCNLKCSHCCYNAVTVTENADLSTKEIIELFNKFNVKSLEKICLTGGEPLVREDFFEIAAYIKEHFSGHLTLMTNGTLINENNVEKIVELFNSINISLDGVDEESCAEIRGKGVFYNVMRAVGLLKGNNAETITLSMVITNATNKEKEFRKLCADLKVNASVRIFSPIGRGFENKEKLLVRSEDKIQTGIRNKIKQENIRCRSCKAGTYILQIDYDGSIYPCGSLMLPEFKIGNLKEKNNISDFLDKIEENKGYIKLKTAMPEYNEICKECDVNIFCNTCPGVFCSMVKVPELFAEHCKLTKKNLSDVIWR